MFTIHFESFTENLAQLRELFKLHYNEVSEHGKRGIPLDPDYDEYKRLEECGKLVFIALRCEGRLVGYATGLIARNLHYKKVVDWHPDLFFVKVEFRGMRNHQNGGVLLLDAIKKEAKRRGCRMVRMGYKATRAKHFQKLLRDGGFEPYEVSYAIWL